MATTTKNEPKTGDLRQKNSGSVSLQEFARLLKQESAKLENKRIRNRSKSGLQSPVRMPRKINDQTTIRVDVSDFANAVLQAKIRKWPGNLHYKDGLIHFLNKYWKSYFKQGLVTRHIMEAKDAPLLYAINTYRRDYKEWPEHLKFATRKKGEITSLIQRAEIEPAISFTPRELSMLSRALKVPPRPQPAKVLKPNKLDV